MEKGKLELISNRLKAINRISHILDQKESTEWDLSQLCRIFVETIGYTTCWIALTDDRGGIRHFTRHRAEGSLTTRGDELAETAFNEYVKESLVQRGDYILDRDPFIDYMRHDGRGTDHIHSVTMKLIHNNIIYGIMSMTLIGDYDFLKEEVLIISELVKTIAFFLYDIDSKNKMQDLLLTMSETTGTGVILIEEDTSVSYANGEFERLCGYAQDEIVKRRMSFTDFVVEEDVPRLLEYHRQRRIEPERAPRNYEFRFRDKGGDIKIIFMTIDMVPRTKTSLASFMNVTEKKRLESQILRVSEQERQRLGNELHDGLGPHLVGIRMMLKLVREKIAAGMPPDAAEIDEIDELIATALDQTRTLARGLKPVDIQPDGLAYAIEEMTSKVRNRYGIACTFDLDPGFSIGDNIRATHLYYIVREAINNALKHSGAKNIQVLLTADCGTLSAEVRDDGRGIANALDSTQGMGISIMKYRASIINATLDFANNEPNGTCVTCRLAK